MKETNIRREIPYNYTSLTDREILQKYAGPKAWETFEALRDERVTGRSAKLLLEIYGDLFIIDRNPYIFYEYIDHPHKIKKLRRLHRQRLNQIRQSAEGKLPVEKLLDQTDNALKGFYDRFYNFEKRKKQIKKELSQATAFKNIRFSAFHRVTHATDATDWRVSYPQCVVYPDSVAELAPLILQAKKAGLTLIPRGGGTGLTGGSVPLYPNTAVINTEKLTGIGEIEMIHANGKEIPVIEAEAGVITDEIIHHCAERGYIFATDPTSAWASTIGGNIAENAGGKKCVMWGTCIDNLYDFQIVNADGETLIIRRFEHPYRKIEAGDSIRFDVFTLGENGCEQLLHSINLESSDIRKKGLGKDITNKALKGLPGMQKEGCDGIISKARFVLYKPFACRNTLCLEFFGNDMRNASKAIVAIRERFRSDNEIFLTALEHIDDKYLEAIQYRVKSERPELPKAVLIIDVESNNAAALQSACLEVQALVKTFETELFIARNQAEQHHFWEARKHLGAIARHTNAFKLNEDIVIPLEKLPQFTDFIDALNIRKLLENQLSLIEYLRQFTQNLNALPLSQMQVEKLSKYRESLLQQRERSAFFLEKLQESTAMIEQFPGPPQPIYKAIASGSLSLNFQEKVIRGFEAIFQENDSILPGFYAIVKEIQRRRIIIATHMHAGDGNSHVNIPVLSSDPVMMRDADATVDQVMAETICLGGVISGEHGIGITKLKYADDTILKEFADYKAVADPGDLFNPGKLRREFPLEQVYTPSFNLLEMEAFALTATDLRQLSEAIANCVRCGKCKSVCNTHFPKGDMLFNSRNKILGVGLIIEAVLYDVLTSKTLSFRHFEKLQEIAAHCTMCHKCAVPCPVHIDFGDVTLTIRKLLKQRQMARKNLMTSLTYHYLSQKGQLINTFFRWSLFRGGFTAQRLAHTLNKPIRDITTKYLPKIVAMLDGRYAKTGAPSFREILNLNDPRHFTSFAKPGSEPKHSVFYFPGCGSERMFPEIAEAALALLTEAGVRVVIPPQYTCCGYPFLSGGQSEKGEKMRADNMLMLYKIAGLTDYMNIEAVLVSCGTCFEMLESYGLKSVFKRDELHDVAAFLASRKLLGQVSDETILFHEPCHSSMKKENFQAILKQFTGHEAETPANCCGDGGTMALANPEISNTLRRRKRENIAVHKPQKSQELMTICPSCVQGLSKINEDFAVNGKHLLVWLAEKKLGKNWKKDFYRTVKQNTEKTFIG
jgi:FAD/FMN-containing dehydrogenase/Fe-S oxidoreductase